MQQANGSSDKDIEAGWRDNWQNAWAALRIIRETIETLGPLGVLISEDEVLAKYGPEPIHEATAIIEALRKMLAQPTETNPGKRRRQVK